MYIYIYDIYIYTNHNKYDLIEKYNVAVFFNEY